MTLSSWKKEAVSFGCDSIPPGSAATAASRTPAPRSASKGEVPPLSFGQRSRGVFLCVEGAVGEGG